jgi:protein CpxP
MKKILLICCLFIGITTASRAQATKVGADPVEKAKGLQKQLNLSDKQTEKVSAIYKESVEKFDKIKVKEHGNTNKMLADVAPLRVATIKKIKGVLTPAQVVKYDKLVKESKNSSLNGGWSDGWTSASN